MSWSARNHYGLGPSRADLLGSVVGHLEPRDVLDFLFQEHALSEDEIELITAGVTRKRRCKRLIQQLLVRENSVQALETFVESLKFDYDFLIGEVSRQVQSYLEQSTGESRVVMHAPAPRTHCEGLSAQRSCCRVPLLPPLQADHTRGKRILKIYNDLSSVLNRGEIDTFEGHVRHYLGSDVSADVKCIVMYLNACKALFQNKVTEALHMYNGSMALVPKTRHPVIYEVEMLSVKAWTYVKHGKLNKLQRVVTGAMQKILSDPRCFGKVAGWIYIDHAHLLVAILESTNPRRAHPLRQRALECLKTASGHFQRDKGNDGPFGFNFALVKYASVLLRCGNNMQFANIAIPEQDLSDAENILRRVENSEHGLPNILRVFYYMARTDLYIRKENYLRALDYAEDMLRLSTDLNMTKEQHLAKIRLTYAKLGNRCAPVRDCVPSPVSADSCIKSGVRGRRVFSWFRECVRVIALLTCIGVAILSPVIV